MVITCNTNGSSLKYDWFSDNLEEVESQLVCRRLCRQPHTRNAVWGQRCPCFSASRRDATWCLYDKNQSYLILERKKQRDSCSDEAIGGGKRLFAHDWERVSPGRHWGRRFVTPRLSWACQGIGNQTHKSVLGWSDFVKMTIADYQKKNKKIHTY